NYAKCSSIKHEIRSILTQISGIWGSTNWQCPSISKSIIEERGISQVEKNTYTRAYGSDYVKSYEKQFIQEYYKIPSEIAPRTLGFITNSGLKALETALLVLKQITGDRFPVFYQAGFYYEGISLQKLILKEVRALHVNEIYDLLDSQEEIGGLIIDSATTWPSSTGIDLELLFEKVRNHKQKSPMVIIYDRTLSSISVQLFEKFAMDLPSTNVLISVESAIKYYQFGLDLINLGCVVMYSSLFRIKKFFDLIFYIFRILTASPDPILIMKMPAPSIKLIEQRMARISKNVELYVSFFGYLKKKGLIFEVFTGIDLEKRLKISHMNWVGSLVYVTISYLSSHQQYEYFVKYVVENAPAELHLHMGASFGFDTTRLSTVSDVLMDSNGESALRFSIGTESEFEIFNKCKYLYMCFEKLYQHHLTNIDDFFKSI
ncbi:hypothetical protein, partial [Paenibacillus humicus]|uniref:hypothetical protein n=1 Tax=Paenibacillus humicus TaxID=412861 RepID=UPI003D2980AD